MRKVFECTKCNYLFTVTIHPREIPAILNQGCPECRENGLKSIRNKDISHAKQSRSEERTRISLDDMRSEIERSLLDN